VSPRAHLPHIPTDARISRPPTVVAESSLFLAVFLPAWVTPLRFHFLVLWWQIAGVVGMSCAMQGFVVEDGGCPSCAVVRLASSCLSLDPWGSGGEGAQRMIGRRRRVVGIFLFLLLGCTGVGGQLCRLVAVAVPLPPPCACRHAFPRVSSCRLIPSEARSGSQQQWRRRRRRRQQQRQGWRRRLRHGASRHAGSCPRGA